MIKSVTWICDICEFKSKIELPIPKFKSQFKEITDCPKCRVEKELKNTAAATYEYVSVVDIELQGLDGFNEIERLPVKIFEKDTYDITAGEVIDVIGHSHVIRKNDYIKNKLETFLFADSIVHVRRQELVLTKNDKKQIQDWKQLQENHDKNPFNELVALFGPELIDLDSVKKGLLIVCASAGFRNVENRFPKRLRLNALLIGDAGLAKTSILEKATRLVPNSQYAGGQSSTGLSLTAQITKEDGGGMYTLRLGPVVLAKDSICAINELGQLPIDEHKHLLDCMEEDGFPIATYGFSTYIEAHPSIIASSNPINNKWQNAEIVSTREFPTLSQVIQRFDLIFVFRENTEPSYLGRYANKRKKTAEDYKRGLYDGNEEFIKKYLLYARSFKPELTEEAYSLLKSFFINMGKAGISGLPRKLDSLIRITSAIAKLKLKNTADIDDAQEAILFYNTILNNLNSKIDF
jgi:replicative DNA helicase Mcm